MTEHQPREEAETTGQKRGTGWQETCLSGSEQRLKSPPPNMNVEEIWELTLRPENLQKLPAPQPPKDSQKPRATTHTLVHKTRLPDDVRAGVSTILPQETAPQLPDHSGPVGPRFDAQGMVLPHSILGSLEDFRIEIESRGETEFVKRIPDVKKQLPLEDGGLKTVENSQSNPKCGLDQQSHALQNWNDHMAERRRQQNFISQLLQKPVGNLLMNQSNRYREVQEQREVISRGLPAVSYGHGQRVGSEFWSVPQRYGDEMTGITATLTQTERGNLKPTTFISQPYITCQETGNVQHEVSVSRTWSDSQYLQHRQHQLRNILGELDFNRPAVEKIFSGSLSQQMHGLEVVGRSPPLRGGKAGVEEGITEDKTDGELNDNEDAPVLHGDDAAEVELVPALRIGGELARWTGNATSRQGEVGISVRVMFEAVVGQRDSSHLELKNEGATAVYYSWRKLPLALSFPEAQRPTHTQHFYFNTSTAVILPGDTEQIEVIFKSSSPGITQEAWLLQTHPLLMGGASLQVTLRGVAFCQDKSAALRAALQRCYCVLQEELEKRETLVVCRTLLRNLLDGVCTPERASSPVEFYTSEEEDFYTLNPNLHYCPETVETLRRLWEETNKSQGLGSAGSKDWNLSIENLRQMLLSLPDAEEALTQYNSLILQLQRPSQPPSSTLPKHCVGLQLWRELLDGLNSKAIWLRHTLGLPENGNWRDRQHECGGSSEEKMDRSALMKEERNGQISREKEKKDGGGEVCEEVQGELPAGETKVEKEVISSSSTRNQLQLKYTLLLHQQVYVMMESMIDSLCELLDEA